MSYWSNPIRDVVRGNPGRPPKAWWDACVRGVRRSGGAYDPASVCGAVWARKSPAEKRAATRRAER